VLTRTRKEEKKPQWLLIKRADAAARPGADEIVLEKPQSVKKIPKQKRQAEKSEVPELSAPQLATLVSEPPRAGEWLYEVKHDGYRMLSRFSGKEVRLFTRTGQDWSAKLPHLARARENRPARQSARRRGRGAGAERPLELPGAAERLRARRRREDRLLRVRRAVPGGAGLEAPAVEGTEEKT